MKYNHFKKSQKKPLKNAIPPALAKDQHFEKIIVLANSQSELTPQDRYLYGYALLKTQKKLASLIALWPLAAKGHTKLYDDCVKIAADILTEDLSLLLEKLSEEDLHILFLAAKQLAPNNRSAYHTIKQTFFNFLWNKKDYEKLERIWKTSKEERSTDLPKNNLATCHSPAALNPSRIDPHLYGNGTDIQNNYLKHYSILIENMSKLAFFQAEKKLTGNTPAFIGCMLTGAAGFITRHPMYHNDIEGVIGSLTNEIKNLFSEWALKSNQNTALDPLLFNSFIDYEASIVVRILKLMLQSTIVPFDIIPTPSYLLNHDAANNQMSQPFLSWLATVDQELVQLYHSDMHHAVIFVLSGNTVLANNIASKFINAHTLNPYVRLAITLRAHNMKKSPLKNPIEINELTSCSHSTHIYKNVLLPTIRLMIERNQTGKEALNRTFWETIKKFYPVLQDTDIRSFLLSDILLTLQTAFQNGDPLHFIEAKNDAHQLQAYDLEQCLDTLHARQKECLHFLSTLDKKKSSFIIKNIKDEHALRAHLTLIADTNQFCSDDQSEHFWHHLEMLVKNKRLNKLIPLKNGVDFDFDCYCPGCCNFLYLKLIPEMIEKYHLPIATIPDTATFSQTQKEISPTKSLFFSESDPFVTLDVSLTDTKPIIMKKVMQKIQYSPDKMSLFRQAQNTLFHIERRFLHHYLRYLTYHDAPFEETNQLSAIQSSVDDIPFRYEFINDYR